MQKHYDIILLGSGQIAQAILEKSFGRRVLVLCRSPEKVRKHEDVDCIPWVAGETAVPLGVTGDLVINCIMPGSRYVSGCGIDAGLSLLSTNGRYTHLSTIAVKSKPTVDSWLIGFSGDVYIRVKKYELTYLRAKQVNKLIIYPGIVVGANTGWDKFFTKLKTCKTASFGFSLDKPAPIIEIRDLAEGILRASSVKTDVNECFFPDPKMDVLANWEECLRPMCSSLTVSNYTYFPSKMKNAIVTLLNSELVPTWVWEKISNLNMSERNSRSREFEKCEVAVQHMNVTGMTNFYIGCDYVL